MRVLSAIFLLLAGSCLMFAADQDQDGLDDAREQQLLEQFAPRFLLSSGDCDGQPSRFQVGSAEPVPITADGTIYGQAFPRADDRIELHYYHLWAHDCGRPSHELDAEHVSTLLDPVADTDGDFAAIFWYAAAHENTVCDASYAARAETLEAVDHGPRVWISGGKHASFLDERLCSWGCGADRCLADVALTATTVLNLGEPGRPLNGALWITSPAWPLQDKLVTDFTVEVVARLEELPPAALEDGGEILRISDRDRTVQSLILTADNTADALVIAGSHTDRAVARGRDETGSAVMLGLEQTGASLKKAGNAVVKFLGGGSDPEEEKAATSSSRAAPRAQ